MAQAPAAAFSIVDLSPDGHQPMLSAGGRFVLALNGEIYNAAEIRSEIAAMAAHLFPRASPA